MLRNFSMRTTECCSSYTGRPAIVTVNSVRYLCGFGACLEQWKNWSTLSVVWSGSPNPPEISVGDTALKNSSQFCYFRPILTSNCSVDAEIKSRIGKACAAFARTRKTATHTHNLTQATRLAVYRAICLSVLPYGLETMTLYRPLMNLLKRFHIMCVKKIFGSSWRDRIPHNEMWSRTKLQSIEDILIKAQLRSSWHVCRVPIDRFPKKVLYG